MFVIPAFFANWTSLYCTELDRKKEERPPRSPCRMPPAGIPKGTALRSFDGLRAYAFTRTIAFSLP